jgi:hypothetical protein
MKTRSKLRAAVITILMILVLVILSPFIYTEFSLIYCKHTRVQDIDEVISVNHGSDYEVLRTVTNNDRKEQIVIVKYDHIFMDQLVKELGCNEYDRYGSLGLYETAGGKKFDMIMVDRSSDAITRLPYAVEKIGGITMAEIIADCNKN